MFQFEPPVLMLARSRQGGHSLYEVEYAFRRSTFLAKDGVDDTPGFRLAEALPLQEVDAVFISPGHYVLSRGCDPSRESFRARSSEPFERRSRLQRKTACSVLRMPDRDLLETLDAPEVPILANRPKIEARDPERL